MKLQTPLALLFSYACLSSGPVSSVVRAEEHGEHGERREEHRDMRAEERHEEHHEERREMRGGHEVGPPRAAPPRFEAHPPGVHPHGPTVRPHAVRVLKPTTVRYGVHPWHRWTHPEFARPVYYWDWPHIRTISCTAEDSYGDQYPVTESTFRGFGLVNMTVVEDDALDRCYAESGGDQSCYLASCAHF
jgi:hypothetical protein